MQNLQGSLHDIWTLNALTNTTDNLHQPGTVDSSTMYAAKRILCVGNCILNIVHICEEEKRSRVSESFWQRSGTASNNCTVLSGLGADCEFFGILSRASSFNFIIEDFKNCNIRIDNCPMVESLQPYASIYTCRSTGDLTIVHTDLGFPVLNVDHFKNNINLQNYYWIHFEGRNSWESKEMINIVRRYNVDIGQNMGKNITISVELAKLSIDVLMLAMRADFVFVGQEFSKFMGWQNPKESVYALRDIIINLQLRYEKENTELDICFRIPHIICPWTTKGVATLTRQYEFSITPAIPHYNVVDIVGSGETFISGIIFALINENKSIKEAVDFGNRLADFKIHYRGLKCIKENIDKIKNLK